MVDIDQVLADLKQRVSAAERKKMLAEVQLEQARSQVDKSSDELMKEYGVSTLAEAKALMASLREDLTKKTEALLKETEKFEEAL